MAEKLDEKELVSFEELLMANSTQVDTATQLLIEKGIITEQEFFTKLKQKVQYQWESGDEDIMRNNRMRHLQGC